MGGRGSIKPCAGGFELMNDANGGAPGDPSVME